LTKRILIFLLTIIFLTAVSCTTMDQSAETSESFEPEEYSDEEFAPWLRELRRAEIIFTGSIPITILLTNIGYGLYGLIESGLGGSYSIENITASSGLTNDERLDVIKISLSLSGAIAAADFIIGLLNNPAEDE